MKRIVTDKTEVAPLESVVQQFEHWRATRGKRRKIPDALWTLVMPLLSQYSHNEIVTALKINHEQLKVGTSPLMHQLSPQKPTLFVEYPLPIPAVAMAENCIIEFTGKNGSAVKISGLNSSQMKPLISFLMGDC